MARLVPGAEAAGLLIQASGLLDLEYQEKFLLVATDLIEKLDSSKEQIDLYAALSVQLNRLEVLGRSRKA